MADDDQQAEAPKHANGKRKAAQKKRPSKKAKRAKGAAKRGGPTLAYPKHSILKCLRIPQAVLENNAGKECTDREAAKFAGLGWSGQMGVEIGSAIKYGLFQRRSAGKVDPTDITRRIIRPQKPTDRIGAIREVLLRAPLVSDLYKHYRGENLPDDASFLSQYSDREFRRPAGSRQPVHLGVCRRPAGG